MQDLRIFGMAAPSWIVLPVLFFIWIIVFTFIKKAVFSVIQRFTKKTETNIDDILIDSLDFPLNLLIFTSAGAMVEQFLSTLFSSQNVELTNYFLIAFKATAIVAVVIFLDKLLRGLIIEYSPKVDVLRSSGGIARGLVRVIVISLGLLILLDNFGVSITPIIASLGIGSLAVVLALQPTLENFFAGIQLVIDKPIQVGNFIKLESGEEGYVHCIGWRSTWVRQLPNNMVIIPNSALFKSRILNYYYPNTEMAVLVQVGVHYASDLAHVEKVTMEVGKQTLQEVSGGVKEFDPFIRYHTFDSSSINFTVILRCKEFVDNYLIKHEFIKRLQKRYKEEGITIPFPIRAINLDQEGSDQILAQLTKNKGE